MWVEYWYMWHILVRIIWLHIIINPGLPWWLRWYRICLQCRKPRFDPWIGKIPWRREWQPIPVFLPGQFQGQRSLVGYSLWSCKESDMPEWLTQTIINPRKQGRDFSFSRGRSFFFSCEKSLEVSCLKRLALWFHGVVSDLGSLSHRPLFSRSLSCTRWLLEAQPSHPSLSSRKEEKRKEEEWPDSFILRKLFGSSTQHFHLYYLWPQLDLQGRLGNIIFQQSIFLSWMK